MNQLSIGIGLGIGFGGGSAPTFAQRRAALAPAAWYRLGEPSGSAVADASGNGRGATQANCTQGQVGAVKNDTNTCYEFNGTSSGVQSSAYVFNSSTASVLCWYRPRVTPASGGWLVCGCDVGGANDKNLAHLSDGTIQAKTFAGGTQMVISSTVLVPGRWYHLALTVDGSTLRLYINGVEEGNTPSAGSYTGYGAPNLAVGSGFGGSVADGWIDEAAWFTTALTAADVLADYTASAKSAVTVAQVVYDSTIQAFWAFSHNIVSVNGGGLGELVINAGGGGYAAPSSVVSGGAGGTSIRLGYGGGGIGPTDAWKIDNEPSGLNFGGDKYLAAPQSGTLTT